MKIKERIVRQAIAEAKAEIKKIDDIMNATPLSDLIRLEIDTIETAKQMPNEKALAYLGGQIKERNRLMRLAEKQQQGTFKFIDRKVELQMELNDLHSELFYIEHKKG